MTVTSTVVPAASVVFNVPAPRSRPSGPQVMWTGPDGAAPAKAQSAFRSSRVMPYRLIHR